MKTVGAQGYTIAPAVLEKYAGDNKNIRILDVAAGTGIVGQVLNQLGFSDVDALDVSEKMLKKAREKNVYRNFIHGMYAHSYLFKLSPFALCQYRIQNFW